MAIYADIPINHTQVPASLPGADSGSRCYRLRLTIASTDIYTEFGGAALKKLDFRYGGFTTGERLEWEWNADPTVSGSTFHGEVWLRVPSNIISHSSDAILRLLADASGADHSTTHTWDTTTVPGAGTCTNPAGLVIHGEQTPTGSANDIIDSSSSANHGTSHGLMGALVTGEIGSALHFDGSDDYVALPEDFIGDWTDGRDMTLSVWFKTTNSGVLFAQNATYDPANGVSGYVPALYIDPNGKLAASLFWHGSSAVNKSFDSVRNDAWRHAAVTYGSGVETLYLDGAQAAQRSVSQTSYAAHYYYFLGTGYWDIWPNASGTVGRFNGDMDEPRFSLAAATADEVAYEYQNINDNASTISIGSWNTVGGTANGFFIGGSIGLYLIGF